MLEVAEALAEVLRRATPLAPALAPLGPALLGRVLAEDACADGDSPPFAKSLRDGYAVRAADCKMPGAELRVAAEVAAGSEPGDAVEPGTCARIFTGAPIPDGADAVVMQEDVEPLPGDRVRIRDEGVKAGQWVFPRGAEMRAGDVVLPAGTVLNPAALGVLAGLGLTRASLFPAP
jgi:molybdopterin molybdotransferase